MFQGVKELPEQGRLAEKDGQIEQDDIVKEILDKRILLEHGGIDVHPNLKDKVVVLNQLGAEYSKIGIKRDWLLSKKKKDAIIVQQELHETL